MAFAIDMLRKRKKGAVSYGDITFKATKNGVASGSIAVSTLGCAAGDVLVICLATVVPTTDSSAPTLSGDVTGAFGAAAGDQYANDTLDCNAFVYVQRLTGADTTITITGGPGGSYQCHCLCFSGVDASTQLDVAVTTATGINSSLANPPSITTATQKAMLVAFWCGALTTNGTAWSGGPSGILTNNGVNTLSQTGGFSRIESGYGVLASVGSLDPAAVTLGGSAATDSWVGFTIALRPATV